MSAEIITHHCQVLVIGSGVSGYCAAIQSGRLGCSTILLEKDEVLGGNSGPNLGVGPTGADRYNPYATETGIIHELQEEAGWIQALTQCSPGSMGYSISRRFEALVQQRLEEAGVRALKRHYARQPVLDDHGRITAVECEDLAAFRRARVEVEHVVIEASGDGEIGALAGAEFDVGSEARAEYGERSAPEERSNLVQGSSLVAIAHRTDHEVPFTPPADLPPFEPRVWHGRIGSHLHHHDNWFANKDLFFLYVTETGGTRDTIRDDAEIHEDLLKQLWAEWDHIKNGPHAEESRCWDLLWVSPKVGKRESRRFLGDVVLTQTHLETGTFWPDDIAWGGHDLDDHRPLRNTADIFGHSIPPLYGIPYRACYSRNAPNLLLAGRLISATHLAHSSTRVMKTGGAIGQAVGCAAALCVRHSCTPREVGQQFLGELQQGLFEHDGCLSARRIHLPDDVAPHAQISATSELRFNDQQPGAFIPLIAPAGVMLWHWPEELRSVTLFLRNTTHAAQPLAVTVHRARRDPKWTTVDDYQRRGRNDLRDQAFELLRSVAIDVPADHVGWLEVDFEEPVHLGEKDSTSEDDRAIVAVSENRNLEWALAERTCDIAEMVEHSHHTAQWRPVRAMATLRLSPAPTLGEAVNVVDGFKQRFSRAPTHMWMSDPNDGLPQELLLEWSAGQTFDQVTLIFDNLSPSRHDYPWESRRRAAPHLVKAFELECWDAAGWRMLARDEANYHRFRDFSFPPVTGNQLRLRVLSTHAPGHGARVYEVRVRT